MERLRSIGVVIAMIVLPLGCKGYSSGAPLAVCNVLHPKHGGAGNQSQPGLAPFSFVASRSVVTEGDTITVSLNATKVFQGFFIVAVYGSNDTKIGSFQSPPVNSTNYQRFPCRVGDSTSATEEFASITHMNKLNKTQLSVPWKAPLGMFGQVCFKGTVAESHDVWWGVLTGDCVQIEAARSGGLAGKKTVAVMVVAVFLRVFL